MKKIFSMVITILLVAMLSVGVAWAKPGGGGGGGGGKGGSSGGGKGNSSGGQASTHVTNSANNGNGSKVSKSSGQLSTSKSAAIKNFKQKLNTYNGSIASGKTGGNTFTDVKEHWAKSNVEKMSSIGLFKGYEDGTFKPDDPVTQAEAVSLVMRIASDAQITDTTTSTTTDATTDTTNTDTIPGWAKGATQKAAEKGIINLNRFHSQVQASRAQVAVMVAKSLGLEPVEITNVPFKDGILISQEDVGYIMALYQNGVIKGTPEGKFNPNSSITRAELAVLMEKVVTQPAEGDGSTQTGDNAQTDGTNSGTTQTGETQTGGTSEGSSQAGNTQTDGTTQTGDTSTTQTGSTDSDTTQTSGSTQSSGTSTQTAGTTESSGTIQNAQ